MKVHASGGWEYILYEILELRAQNSLAKCPSQFNQHRQNQLSWLADEFSALLDFHTKYILNSWSMQFDPAKVSLIDFAITFKILSAHCDYL